MAAYETDVIDAKYHRAIVDWQKRYFPELASLEKNWGKYFGKQTPFQLVAKVGKLRSETIAVGRYRGSSYFERAADLAGNMFFTAQGIIKAQCSTELGSIQQHQMSLDKAVNDEMKYGILRIMAEELRHAYQMFWVLEHDPTWKKAGMGDVADETIQELLTMETGKHVLDAFNIKMTSFLDNTMFATLIDLVGKYQLDMQSVFSYAPMARSMPPMLQEEGFHLGHGRKSVRTIAVMAAEGKGDFSMRDIQTHLNKWLPRGLEMFGNEKGGGTNVEFGFKDRTNGEAQSQYYDEVRSVVRDWSCAVVQQVYRPGSAYEEAAEIVDRIWETKEAYKGVKPEMILFTPDRKFFRKRGLAEFVFKPYDVYGTLLTGVGGLPISCDDYVVYLKGELPEAFQTDPEWTKFESQIRAYYKQGGQGDVHGASYSG